MEARRSCFASLVLGLTLSACGAQNGTPLPTAAGASPHLSTAEKHRGVRVTIRMVIGGPHRRHRDGTRPNFVSPSSNGVLVQVYLHGAAHTPANLIAHTATNIASGSPACGGKTGFPRTCTATLVTKPTGTTRDDLVILLYDQTPSGGTIPPSAHLLGIGSLDNEALTAGKANALSVFIGGLIASLAGNSPFVSFPADGSAHQLALVIDPKDFGNNTISAGSHDPFANPIAVTLSETGGSGHTLVSLNGGTLKSSATVTKSSDTVSVHYDGSTALGYTVLVTLKSSAANGAGGATEVVRISPLELAASNSDYSAGSLALRGNGDEVLMTVGEAAAPVTPAFTATPSGCVAVADVTGLTQSGGTGRFSVFADPMASNSGCSISVSDGTNAIDVNVSNTYSGVLGTPSISTFGGLTSSASPYGITVGADGAMWFAEKGVPKIGRISATGTSPTVTEYPLPTAAGTPAPTSVGHGPDGNIWWTTDSMTTNGYIVGSITPAGSPTGYTQTAQTWGIVQGPDGAMWFTDGRNSAIGRIDKNGTVTEYTTGLTSGSNPTGITVGPDGNLWFTEFCVTKPHIGKITTSGTITEYALSLTQTGLYITTGPDGALYFTTESDGIGRFTTSISSGSDITFYSSGITGSGPEGITTGPDGALWFAEGGSSGGTNYIGRMTTDGTIHDYAIPSSTNTFPFGIGSGPDGAVWFTQANGNNIGRVKIQSSAAASHR